MVPIHKRKYTRHEYSALFGDIGDEDLATLGEDIKEKGLANVIFVTGSQIVDGWNRYSAARAAGYEFTEDNFIEYDEEQDGPLLGLVISLNVNRRHLTDEARVEIAQAIMKEGAKAKHAAKAVGIHPKSLSRAISKKTKGKKEETVDSLATKREGYVKKIAEIDKQIENLQLIANKTKPAAPARRRSRSR